AAGAAIALHDFSGSLGELRVHFHAMRLRDSLFLWVGAAPALASLAVAMCSPRDSIPVATSLLGDPSDTASACLAQRLGSWAQHATLSSAIPSCLDAAQQEWRTHCPRKPCLTCERLHPVLCLSASKTKKQIFVSYNLQNTDSSFTLLIENRIKEEMLAFPDKF
ncbi:PSMG4 protein, partial [Bucco capensis]|nr:PSMG4 protein [Bucco capensis]